MASSAEAQGGAGSKISSGSGKSEADAGIARGMLRLYARLEDDVLSILDADEELDRKRIDAVVLLLRESANEFIYVARRMHDAKEIAELKAQGRTVFATQPSTTDRAALKADASSELARRNLVDDTIRLSDALGLNEYTCAGLLLDADNDVDDGQAREFPLLLRGVMAYYRAMHHMFNTFHWLLYCRTATDTVPPTLRSFAQNFLGEMEYLVYDLLILAHGNTLGNGVSRTAVMRVELKHLEALNLVNNAQEKGAMAALLEAQQQALANCISELAIRSYLAAPVSASSTAAGQQVPLVKDEEVLAMLRVLADHLRGNGVVAATLSDSLCAALFVGLTSVLDVSFLTTGGDKGRAVHHVVHPLDPRAENAPPIAQQFVKVLTDDGGTPEALSHVRRVLHFVWGMQTDNDDDVRQALLPPLPEGCTPRPVGVFEYMSEVLLSAPQFSPEHVYNRVFTEVLHELLAKFVGERWASAVDEIRRTARDASADPGSDMGPDALHAHCDYADLFRLAGKLYGAPRPVGGGDELVDSAWETWSVFAEECASQLHDLGVYLAYLEMLTGLAGPDTTPAMQSFHRRTDADTGVEHGGDDGPGRGERKGNAAGVHAFLCLGVPQLSWKHLMDGIRRHLGDLERLRVRQSEAIARGMPQWHEYSVLNEPNSSAVVMLSTFLRLLRRVVSNNPQGHGAQPRGVATGASSVLPGETPASILDTLWQLFVSPVQPGLKAELLGVLEAFCIGNPDFCASVWARLQLLHRRDSGTGHDMALKFQHEIEEIESSYEEYPLTRALLSLHRTILPHLPPLDASGYTSQLRFFRDVVLLKYGGRAYKQPLEKWLIIRDVLSVYVDLLDAYVPRDSDFIHALAPTAYDDDTAAPGYEFLAGNARAGYDLMEMLLGESPSLTLTKVLQIIELGTHADAVPSKDTVYRTAFLDTIRLALKLVVQLLEKQRLFVKYAMVQKGKRMEDHLLASDRLTGLTTWIHSIAQYLWVDIGQEDEGLALHTIKILYLLSASPISQPELEVIFRSTSDADPNAPGLWKMLTQACVDRLSVSGRRASAMTSAASVSTCVPPEDPTDVFDNRCETNGVAISHSIVHLILLNLSAQHSQRDAVTLAHILLGFDIHANSAADIASSVLGKSRSCLQSMVQLVQPNDTTESRLVDTDPVLNELIHKLLYRMCFNVCTSKPTLKYLRDMDFFVKELDALVPVPREDRGGDTEGAIASTQPDRTYCALLNHQGWFLKTLALEIFATSKTRRRADGRLLNKLFEQKTLATGSIVSDPQMCVLKLLQAVDLAQAPVQGGMRIGHDESVRAQVNTLYENCVSRRPDMDGLLWCDVVAFLEGLEDLQSSENSIRDDEIDEIVHAATESNLMRQAIRAKQNFFDGWRRVVCVPLVQCPMLLPAGTRGRCIADLLILLFAKIEPEDRIPELLNAVADVVVMLMSTLRQYVGEVLPEQGDALESTRADGAATLAGDDELSDTTLRQIHAGIKLGIRHANANPAARQSMYGALLFYLQIVNNDRYVDGERGDHFMEMVCRDADNRQDVGKALSLAAITAMVTLESASGSSRWLNFLQRRGFLNSYVNEIGQSDAELVKQLSYAPKSFLPLHLYQAKMSLLNRLALSPEGAAMLFQADTMLCLRECRFVGARPSEDSAAASGGPDDGSSASGAYGTPMERHRELVFPVLRLACSMVESGAGIRRHDIVGQVLYFVAAHAETYFKVVLQDWYNITSVPALEELSLVTSLLRLVSHTPTDSDSVGVGGGARSGRGAGTTTSAEAILAHHATRLQTLMVSLLGLLSDRDALLKKLDYANYTGAGQTGIDRHILNATANVVGYVRSAMGVEGSSSANDGQQNGTGNIPRGERGVDGHGSAVILLRPSLDKDTDGASSVLPAGSPSLGAAVRILAQVAVTYKAARGAVQRARDGLYAEASLLQEPISKKQKLAVELEHHTDAQSVALYTIENVLYIVWKHLEFYLTQSMQGQARDGGALSFAAYGHNRSGTAGAPSSAQLDNSDIARIAREFLSTPDLDTSQPHSLLSTLVSQEKDRLKDDPMPRTTIQPLVRRIHDLRRLAMQLAKMHN
eukprot:m.1520393 g.1520393  ORF g.1520393 m.1520393 type:complete len:2076 (+) comp25227_c0_seq1:203-6430(+)